MRDTASFIKRPLVSDRQPISATVFTESPGKARRRRGFTHSSRRMRIPASAHRRFPESAEPGSLPCPNQRPGLHQVFNTMGFRFAFSFETIWALPDTSHAPVAFATESHASAQRSASLIRMPDWQLASQNLASCHVGPSTSTSTGWAFRRNPTPSGTSATVSRALRWQPTLTGWKRANYNADERC